MSQKGREIMVKYLVKSVIMMATAFSAPVYAGSHSNNGPISQQQFCSIISDYRTDYEEAIRSNNEIRINNVLKKRSDDLDALLPNGDFKDWEVEFLKACRTATMTNPCHPPLIRAMFSPTLLAQPPVMLLQER